MDALVVIGLPQSESGCKDKVNKYNRRILNDCSLPLIFYLFTLGVENIAPREVSSAKNMPKQTNGLN